MSWFVIWDLPEEDQDKHWYDSYLCHEYESEEDAFQALEKRSDSWFDCDVRVEFRKKYYPEFLKKYPGWIMDENCEEANKEYRVIMQKYSGWVIKELSKDELMLYKLRFA